jgi:hypothetical protein
MNEETPTVCPHTNLVKQTGPMDGGAASTRYQCGAALTGPLREAVEKIEKWGTELQSVKHPNFDPICGQDILACAVLIREAVARMRGCSAFFVVAPHEIGVSIGPPSDDDLVKCARCLAMKECLLIETGFAGEREPLCADCISTERAHTEPSSGLTPTASATHGLGETTFREDERQACWEDFVQVLRHAITDKSKLRDVLHGVFLQGWKDLGTGDGKPMHQREDSAVRQWLEEHRHES